MIISNIMIILLFSKIRNLPFPKFKYGKCLLEQRELLSNNKNNELYKYHKLPMTHPPSCKLDNSNQEKNKEINFASVGIIKDKDGKVLLTKRKNTLSQFPDTWVFPGGKLNKNENFITGLLREINEETGIKIYYDEKTNKYKYNGLNILIKPIFLYESIFPSGSKKPTHQNLIVFFSINFPIIYNNIKYKIQKSEIDAFIWIDINILYKIIYMDYNEDILGFKYNEITKKYKSEYFNYKNFRPNFINVKKEIIDSSLKKEFITHGHRTAIKFLLNV